MGVAPGGERREASALLPPCEDLGRTDPGGL